MLRLAALMPLALVACVDSGDEGIYVLNNTAVTEATCSLSGSPDQAMLGHGVINVDSPTAYVMTPLIQSRITPIEGVDDISKTVQLRGADVRLVLKAVTVERSGQFSTTNPNSDVGAPFSVLFSGAISPGASVNAFVDIIPPGTLRSIAAMSGANLETDGLSAEVLAEVTIKGDLNGDSIESQPFLYPVTVCNDCVINFVGDCAAFMGTARTGNACNPFQDGVVDCCASNGSLVCPVPSAM